MLRNNCCRRALPLCYEMGKLKKGRALEERRKLRYAQTVSRTYQQQLPDCVVAPSAKHVKYCPVPHPTTLSHLWRILLWSLPALRRSALVGRLCPCSLCLSSQVRSKFGLASLLSWRGGGPVLGALPSLCCPITYQTCVEAVVV